MIHTDCHTFDPIFSPPFISPKPLFLPKIVTLSHSVTSVQNFWKFFTQRPLIGWNLRKRYQNAAYFVMAFVTEKPPYFFALHTYVCLRGMLPQRRSEAGKFCILETESSNLGNTFRCKFNKGDENKNSFLQAQPTQLSIIWMNFIGGGGRDDTGYHPPSQTQKGIYPTNTLYKSAPLAL